MSTTPLARWVAIALVAWILVPAVALGAEDDPPTRLTWGVTPSSPTGPDGRAAFLFDLAPGDSLVDHVAVVNYGHEPVTFSIYASDATATSGGGFDLLPADQPPRDVGGWVTFGAPTVTVPARSRADIPFRLTVPDDATPGDHAGGIVASLSIDDPAGGVRRDHRVGARIYLRVDGDLDARLIIDGPDAGPAHGWTVALPRDLNLAFAVINPGNVRLEGNAEVEVAGPFGLGRRVVDLEPLPEILPDNILPRAAEVTGLRPIGWHTITVTVRPHPTGGDVGPLTPVTATTTVMAIPFSESVLLLVATFLALRRLRSRRRTPQNS